MNERTYLGGRRNPRAEDLVGLREAFSDLYSCMVRVRSPSPREAKPAGVECLNVNVERLLERIETSDEKRS